MIELNPALLILGNGQHAGEMILKDEAVNYSYGKVTLNDYITAVNRVDENRFSYTEHSVQLNKLLIEWLRLTDQLVGKDVLDKSIK